MSTKSAWLELSMRITLTLRAYFFVYFSDKGNINFIKGSGEGEGKEGVGVSVGVCVCVCVCAVIHIGKSRPFSYFTRS